MFAWHLKQFIHISIWRKKVIKLELWLIVLRFDLRGSDWINDGLTGIHWSGRKELQVCSGTNVIIWGYDLFKVLHFHWWRIFFGFVSQQLTKLNQCLTEDCEAGHGLILFWEHRVTKQIWHLRKWKKTKNYSSSKRMTCKTSKKFGPSFSNCCLQK